VEDYRQVRSLAQPAGDCCGATRRTALLRGRNGERGGGKLKALIFVAVLVSIIYVGVKVIPVLISEYEFQDAMQSAARLATVNRSTPETLRAAVLKEAQDDDIPVSAEDIHVKGEGGRVEIEADYSVTVDLRVYQWTLNFHPSASNNPLL